MTSTAAEGRHASWLELFFDLVIVAAVAQLARLLHGEPGLQQVFLFVVFYYCIWSVWTSFTLYANVVGDRTRQRTILLAMFGIAVMAATVPKAAHGESDPFVLAFILCRVLAGMTWSRTGKVMTSWVSAQTTYAFIPWVLSLWLDDWKYYLWALAILIDVVISAVRAGNPDGLVRQEQQRLEEFKRREMERVAHSGGNAQPRRPPHDQITAARLDVSHFSERLGLFVIIVLGEAVAQVVNVAADEAVTAALWRVVLAGFGLLVCFWWLTLQYGATAAPMNASLPPRITLPMHFVMTGAIVAIAAGLGAMAEHADVSMPPAIRWVLCGGAAAYFLSIAVIGIASQAPRVWILGWALPSIAACVLLGVFGGLVEAWWLAVGLLAVADWQVLYPRVTGRRPSSGETGPELSQSPRTAQGPA